MDDYVLQRFARVRVRTMAAAGCETCDPSRVRAAAQELRTWVAGPVAVGTQLHQARLSHTMFAMKPPTWSSLEVAKLLVAFLTPLAVLFLGIWVKRAVGRLEDAQWANRKLVEHRLDVYRHMAEPLNDLLCFFRVIGHFREIRPPDVIDRKRTLDRTFHVNEYLLSEPVRVAYRSFIDGCFLPYQGVGQPAKIRAHIQRQRLERPREWELEWDDLFVASASQVTGLADLTRRYKSLQHAFAQDLGLETELETLGDADESPRLA
jgi:hypothetical protein